MATLTLVCVGDDRPGLVSALSAPISEHGASWQHSQMTRLAGKFAGVLLLQVPDANVDGLVADLTELKDIGLQVTLERTGEPAERPSVRLDLELIGADHPGIVAEISSALAAQHIGIEELSTDLREAPMAGGMLFEARAVLEALPTTDMDDLRLRLEAIADELMVEIKLSNLADT